MDFSLSHFSSPLSVSEAGHVNNLSKRQKVVKEIFDSEQTYLSQLQTIIDLFLKPIRTGGLLPPNSISIIFSNVEGLLGVNIELFNFMKQQSLGDAFTYLGPFLKMYASYASNYQMAIELLERSMKRDQGFSNFIETQESRPECNYLKLSALLITPVQRIPRYEMLLDKLLKLTKQTHIDYSKISGATQQITAIASFINEYIRQHENAQKMIKIQASLSAGGGGGSTTVPGIVVPGRRFIKEGRLMKLCRKKPKERIIFLFSDILVYARANVWDVRSLICRGVLPLVDGQVQVLLSDSRIPGDIPVLQLTTADNNCIILFSDRKEETVEWADDIQAAILDLHNDILSPKPVNYHTNFTSFNEQSYGDTTRPSELEMLAFPPAPSASPIGGHMPTILETPASPFSISPTIITSTPIPPLTQLDTPVSTNTPMITLPVTVSTSSPLPTVVSTNTPVTTNIPVSTTTPTMAIPVSTNTPVTISPVLSSTPVPSVPTSTPTISVPVLPPLAPLSTTSPVTSTTPVAPIDSDPLVIPSPTNDEETGPRMTEMEIEEIPTPEQERIPLLPPSTESASKCCIIS